MMELTAHWRDGRGPHEPVDVGAVHSGQCPINPNARRLVRWSLANLSGGRMTRPPLKNAFDCDRPQDGGAPIREDEIKTLQETLSRQGRLEGGGQGRAYRITAALQARVEQPAEQTAGS